MKIVTAAQIRLIRRQFTRSLGSLVAISPAVHLAEYPHESEQEALRSDWLAIGNDMKTAIARRSKDVKKIREKYSKHAA
jgi:hypothetical protein